MGGTDGDSRWVGGTRERRRSPTGVLEGVDLHVQQREGLSEAVGHRRLLLLEDLGHLRRSGKENHLHVIIIINIFVSVRSVFIIYTAPYDPHRFKFSHNAQPVSPLLLKPTKTRILV